MSTLHCPHCGYNLSNLPEDRCPECGKPFDRAKLITQTRSGMRPIQLREFVFRLAMPPGVFLIGLLILGLLSSTHIEALIPIGVVVSVLAGLFWLIAGLANAINLARRLAANHDLRAERTRTDSERSAFVFFVSAGLWLCQFAIGFGGCAAAVMVGNAIF